MTMHDKGTQWIRVLLASVMVAIALGCSTPVRVSSDFDPETDFTALTTWDWVPDLPEAVGAQLASNTLLKDRVSTAVARTLAGKDYRRVEQSPDFRVGFTFGTQETLQVRSQPTTTVVHGRAGRGRSGVYTSWGGSRVDVRQFTEGTLVIDILVPNGERLLWRGTGTSRIREERDPQRRTEIVNDAVARILAQFPPKR